MKVLIADDHLQRHEDAQQPERHRQHGPPLFEVAACNDIACANREHDETCREVRCIEHMREAVRKTRIEDDGQPVCRMRDAANHLVAGWRLHPAVRR